MLQYLPKFFQCLLHFCSTAVSAGFGLSWAEDLLLDKENLWLTAGARLKPRLVEERHTAGCLLNDQNHDSIA